MQQYRVRLCVFRADNAYKCFIQFPGKTGVYLENFILKCIRDVWDVRSRYSGTRRSVCFLITVGSGYEEILKFGIEVKAGSDKCLVKSVAVA